MRRRTVFQAKPPGIPANCYRYPMPARTGLLAVLLCTWLLASCGLLGDSGEASPDPLPFDEIRVHYTKYGGWIPTATLRIEPTGKAEATLGRGEAARRDTAVLSGKERERLSELMAWFPTYRRSYEPEDYITDANHHRLVLSYRGERDTVSVYFPAGTVMPSRLRQTLKTMEALHEEVLSNPPPRKEAHDPAL